MRRNISDVSRFVPSREPIEMPVVEKVKSFPAAPRVPPAGGARVVPTRSTFTRPDDVEFFRRVSVWPRAADWGQSALHNKIKKSLSGFRHSG